LEFGIAERIPNSEFQIPNCATHSKLRDWGLLISKRVQRADARDAQRRQITRQERHGGKHRDSDA